MMKNTILTLLISVSSALFLSAQSDQSVSSTQKLPSRSAWFIYTDLPEGFENPVKVMTGNDITEVTLSKRSASGPVKIPADGIIRIVREVSNPAEPGENMIITLAQASITETVNKALVILLPLAKPQGNLLFNAKVQNLANFKGGDWLYLNLTSVDVRVQLGGDNLTIKPGRLIIQAAVELDEPINMPISYSYLQPQTEQWKLITASTVVIMPTRREICIFSADPRFGRISYHGVTFPVE